MAAGALAEVVTEEVATNLEEVAEGVRRLNTTAIGYLFGGIAVGAIAGFYFGYRFNREKIRAEAFKQSEEEVTKIREVYAARHKPSVEEVVEERGYSTYEPPRIEELHPRLTKPPVVVTEPPVVIIDDGNVIASDWEYDKEIELRTEHEPYIIHVDEWEENTNGYDKTEYTYWAVDDVLTDSDNRPLPHASQIVGRENLKFGHGSGDDDVVFVRNDRLELEMEITRSPLSYEQEIMGLDRNDQQD